jgi:hypothetical protein
MQSTERTAFCHPKGKENNPFPVDFCPEPTTFVAYEFEEEGSGIEPVRKKWKEVRVKGIHRECQRRR